MRRVDVKERAKVGRTVPVPVGVGCQPRLMVFEGEERTWPIPPASIPSFPISRGGGSPPPVLAGSLQARDPVPHRAARAASLSDRPLALVEGSGRIGKRFVHRLVFLTTRRFRSSAQFCPQASYSSHLELGTLSPTPFHTVAADLPSSFPSISINPVLLSSYDFGDCPVPFVTFLNTRSAQHRRTNNLPAPFLIASTLSSFARHAQPSRLLRYLHQRQQGRSCHLRALRRCRAEDCMHSFPPFLSLVSANPPSRA
jgi:hypothetical protein